MREGRLLIAGQWRDGAEHRDVRNPYSGEVIGRTAVATAGDAAEAVEAAQSAHAEGAPPQHERAEILDRARALVLDRQEDLARTIAEESGKPLKTARTEAARCADTLLFAATEARTLAGSVVPMEASGSGAGKLGFTLLTPRGVVASITPFNFPLNLVCHKLAPAFAAGCPVILKPASDTPFSGLALAGILVEAGMPDGFLSVLTGEASVVGPGITAPDAVKVISFTGSTDVGQRLARDNPGKRVLLELGSNAPVIVDASADLELAARRLARTGFSHAGQSCISAQRVYVHRDVRDAFLDALLREVGALVTGDPLDEAVDVGPLIRTTDRDRVLAWIGEAVEAGAKIRIGGKVNPDGTLQPTVLDDVTPDMKVSAQEIFGPVLAVQAVDDLDEAIRLANDSRYGLHAGIFTADLDTALRAARELDFGGVLVNDSPTFRADQMPYGGVRDSGNTREGPAWAIHDYLDQKLVLLHLPQPDSGRAP
jgi:acyl-CoA reductase-like NAD-dependent aldehyde dehydrogenase